MNMRELRMQIKMVLDVMLLLLFRSRRKELLPSHHLFYPSHPCCYYYRQRNNLNKQINTEHSTIYQMNRPTAIFASPNNAGDFYFPARQLLYVPTYCTVLSCHGSCTNYTCPPSQVQDSVVPVSKSLYCDFANRNYRNNYY